MSAEPRVPPGIDLLKALHKSSMLGIMYSRISFVRFSSEDPAERSQARRTLVKMFIDDHVAAASSSLCYSSLVRVTVPVEHARAGHTTQSGTERHHNMLHLDDFVRALSGVPFMWRLRMQRVVVSPLGSAQSMYEVDIRVDTEHAFWDVLSVEIRRALETNARFTLLASPPDLV